MSSTDLTSSNDKQNALDAIPTSSTDANVTFAKTETAIEDPISSTSSEVCLAKCSEDESDHFLTDSGGSDITSVNMGQSKSRVEQPQAAALESEEEFLNLNMENVSNERITENVEDIVHALENLLGDSYTIPDRGATTTPMKTSEDVTLALAELEELTKNEGESQKTTFGLSKEQETPQNTSISAAGISSVELAEVTTEILEVRESETETSELAVEETEVVPRVTEPVTVSSAYETEEIHSTIYEESDVATSPRKSQKIKLIRSPIRVQASQEEQFEDAKETLEMEVSASVEETQAPEESEEVGGSNETVGAELRASIEERHVPETSEEAKETVQVEVNALMGEVAKVEVEVSASMEEEQLPQRFEESKDAKGVVQMEVNALMEEEEISASMEEKQLPYRFEESKDVKEVVQVEVNALREEEEISASMEEKQLPKRCVESQDAKEAVQVEVNALLEEEEVSASMQEKQLTEPEDIKETVQVQVALSVEEKQLPDTSEEAKEIVQMEVNAPPAQMMEVETVLPPLKMEIESIVQAEKFSPEPMVVDEDKNEVEMDEEIEQPILIDDPVVTATSLAIECDDVPAVELEPPVFDEVNPESIAVVADGEPLIPESSVIDDLIGNIVAEPIDSTAVSPELEPDSLKIPQPTEDVVMVEDKQDEDVSEDISVKQSNLDISAIKIATSPPNQSEASSSLASQMIDPSLKTTLTVDVNEQETYETASPKAVVKQESQHLLKITISKQADNTHSILKVCSPGEPVHSSENIERIPKISIKSLMSPQEGSSKASKQMMSPTSVPKLTIKPIVKPDSPVKLTIKPILKPDEIQEQQRCSPKLLIKPIVKPDDLHEQRASPKLTIKPIVKPDDLHTSPKVIIKPLVKPHEDMQEVQIEEELQRQARSSPKITIKPIIKPEVEEGQKQKFSPKLTIKPIVKPEETIDVEQYHQKCSPKLTIKPIVKPEEEEQQKHPKLTIKPIVRPEEQMHSPKITIKPIVKPQEETEPHNLRHSLRSARTEEQEDIIDVDQYNFVHIKTDCPKVTIKPVVKPAETTSHIGGDYGQIEDDAKQERIILKINKNTLPSRKREYADEKLAKIKVKYSKEGGHAHIVSQTLDSAVKQPQIETETELRKRFKLDDINIPQGITITNVEPVHKDDSSGSQESSVDDVKIEPIERVDTSVFSVTHPVIDLESKDPLGDIPSFDGAVVDFAAASCSNPSIVAAATAPVVVPSPPPRKRGRPRKVPLQVREEFKDPPKEEEEPKPIVIESTRPKRSCRGQSVRTTLGIKPRKPRGPGKGRGGRPRLSDTRATVMKAGKEPKVSIPKLKLLKETITNAFADDTDADQSKDIDIKHTSITEVIDTTVVSRDVPIYEEETRMSADAGSSRAQTPAKQIPTPIGDVVVEESQSSVQSTATTESVKARKGPRLEVHQEPEGAIISADQLAEYSWGGGGPYMLQEQVAQFLGIKSFKRKYPGIQRRPVDMQERDFIRESGLASEAMCDLGLTAVNSADILDIMYSDFQPKYEEYCKHQRDRQAKDLTNKQKALTLVVSQEKNNLTEQAVQSAAAWNSTFNKTRREKRKACMDLQTFTIHYPKGKVKQINKPPVGNYPIALVPGQFTDYYTEFTPTELNNLPLNTLCYNNISAVRHQEDDSQSDGSASDSDSSSSDSDSSESGSSEGENCTMCSNSRSPQKQVAAMH